MLSTLQNKFTPENAMTIGILASILFTLLFLFFNGYDPNGSEYHYLVPLAEKNVHPELFSKDLALSTPYYSFFPFLIAGLLALSPQGLFIGYIAVVFALFVGIWMLSWELFKSYNVSILSSVLFLTPKGTLSAAFLYNYFSPSFTVIPLQLFAIYFMLKNKPKLSFLVIGLGFFIHPLHSIYLAGALVVYVLIFKKQWISSIAVYIAAVLVALAYYLTKPFTSFGQQWLEIISLRSPHHFLPRYLGLSNWIFTAALIGIIAWIAWREYKKRNGKLQQDQKLIFTIASVVILEMIAGTVIAIIPIVSLMRQQFFQAARILPYIIIPVIAFYTLKDSNKLIRVIGTAICIGLFFYPVIIWNSPIVGGNEPGNYSELNSTGEWAKANTPVDALFIVPPTTDFRRQSSRSQFATRLDGGITNGDEEALVEWFERMKMLGYEEIITGKKVLNNSVYNELEISDFEFITEKYGPAYILRERGSELPLQPEYENEGFIVYYLG